MFIEAEYTAPSLQIILSKTTTTKIQLTDNSAGRLLRNSLYSRDCLITNILIYSFEDH